MCELLYNTKIKGGNIYSDIILIIEEEREREEEKKQQFIQIYIYILIPFLTKGQGFRGYIYIYI